MAVLDKLPEKAIISAFKGVVDFYLWKGIPVARKWPYFPKREPSPLEIEIRQTFAYANHMAGQLPEYIIDQYKRMATGTPFSWKDLFVRSYISGIQY